MLKSLLPFSIASKLEMILVECCESMEKVVSFEFDAEYFDFRGMPGYEFPKLKRISLMNLPKLIGWSGAHWNSTGSASTLFNKMVHTI